MPLQRIVETLVPMDEKVAGAVAAVMSKMQGSVASLKTNVGIIGEFGEGLFCGCSPSS